MPESVSGDVYPLSDSSDDSIRSRSGRPLSELTLENVRAGKLRTGDFSISDDTLRRQAALSAASGYVELAANLRRAAELVSVPDEKLLEIYDALRPGRKTFKALIDLAGHMIDEYDARETAKLIRDTAENYQVSGKLLAPE